jgi:hypothetical protein
LRTADASKHRTGPTPPSGADAEAAATASVKQPVRLWSLQRGLAQDSFVLGLGTERGGRHLFALHAVDILSMVQAVLDERDRPPSAAPIQ